MKRPLLTGETTEISARLTKVGPDDRAFAAARRRRRKKRPEPPPMPETGPCCGRCAHWEPPGPSDEFGACGRLAYVRFRLRSERNHVEAMERAIRMATMEDATIEALRTRAGFSCSRYEAT